MDNERLKTLVEEHGSEIEGRPGFWRFQYRGREVHVITDERHNRMRIMSAVAPEDQLSTEGARAVLAANFDRALDVRFAISQGVLWSLYLHPLRELSDRQFIDALNQVCQLADNFGTTYASSNLVFGGKE